MHTRERNGIPQCRKTYGPDLVPFPDPVKIGQGGSGTKGYSHTLPMDNMAYAPHPGTDSKTCKHLQTDITWKATNPGQMPRPVSTQERCPDLGTTLRLDRQVSTSVQRLKTAPHFKPGSHVVVDPP